MSSSFLSLAEVLSGFGMGVILALKNSLEVFLLYLNDSLDNH